MDNETVVPQSNEDFDIRDPLTRGLLEQTLLNNFEQLEASINALDSLGDDVEVRTDPVKIDLLKLEERAFGERARLEHLKRIIGANHDENVRFRIRDLLARDEYIISAGKYYGIALEDQVKDITEAGVHRVRFTIIKDEFQEWRTYHAGAIGVSSVIHRDYVSTRTGLHTMTYLCQCHGLPQKRNDRSAGGTSGKVRAVQKASIKCSCPAKFIATETLKGIKEKAMVIDLYYHHTHNLASLEDIGTKQKSDRIKATIKSLLLQGSSIKNVMERLTMDYDRFMDVVRGNGQRLSRDDFITYEDVYNIWYKINNEMMRKDPDASLSAVKWLEEIENKGGFAFYDKLRPTSGIYFGFSTEWQLRQLRKYGQSLCFDGTHNVFGPKTNLFTLVLKNKDHGFGVPVALILTRSSNPTILISWLKALCEKMRQIFSTPDSEYEYKPNAVITDQGNTEILAVKAAFPETRILYCAWHVLRAWEREIRSKMTTMENLSTKERNHLRELVRLDLRAILYEKDKAVAFGRIAQFRIKWKDQEELMKFLDKNYFGRDPSCDEDNGDASDEDGASDADDDGHERSSVEGLASSAVAAEDPVTPATTAALEKIQLTVQGIAEHDHEIAIARKRMRWMLCYRQDLSYASIDTNNYIESWHNTLKQHFLYDKQQRRVDTVIFVLNVMAVPHYQRKCMRSLVNVGEMNPGHKAEAQHLQRIKEHLAAMGELGPTMYQLTDDIVAVGSFTAPGTFHNIKVDFTRVSTGHIVKCDCPAFKKEETCCKHIALLQLEIPHLRFLKVDREDIHRDLDLLALAPPVAHEQWDEQQLEPVQGLDLSYYINRIKDLEALRDTSKPMPHGSQLCSLLDRFLSIYEPSFPRKEGQDLSNKRQRMQF